MLNLQDKIEIQELSARYANAMDNGDIDAWLNTWTDDGVWQGGLGKYEGKSSLEKLLADLGARIQGKRHVMCNFVITEDGDGASQQSYLLVFDRETAPTLISTGVYHDTLRKVDGQWKFVSRSVKLDPSFRP